MADAEDLSLPQTTAQPNGEPEPDLSAIVAEFAEVQAALNYQQAQTVMHQIVDKLDLTETERSGLEPELATLATMLDKLDRQVIQITVFGMVGRGKSSLLNALLGQEVFETGPTHGVTQQIQSATWTVRRESIGLDGSQAGESAGDLWRVSLPGLGNSQIEVIDTPGIDEIDGETRERMARQLAKQADLILFVVAGDLTQVEFAALSELRRASKPILLVLNKIDQYPDADRQAIYEKIRDDRVRELLSPDEIVMAAAAPLVARAVRQADGKIKAHLSRGTPQVEDLKLKILEILHREGKALVALNTMLYANDVSEQIVQRKLEIRDRSANRVIWNSVITKSVAVAINPIMLVDLLSGTAIDIALIVALSRLYGIPMTQQAALALLQKIILSTGGITASEWLITLGLGSLKSFLGAAAPATGGLSIAPYLTVAVTQASLAGLSIYAIGQITKTYLAQGASWGADGPKAVVGRILASLDQDSILQRIRQELWAKLDLEKRLGK